MNVSPINDSNNYKQSFKANIPYTRKIGAAFNYAEKLLTNTTHKYSPYDTEDILIHPSPKLRVHDFCENIKYLLSDTFKPNETLELGFEYCNVSTSSPMARRPWMFHWRTSIEMKESQKVKESYVLRSVCDVNADLKQVKEQACFDILNSYASGKRCHKPDLIYYSQFRLNEIHEQELKERNHLEENLSINNLKTKLHELKEHLIRNAVFEKESIKENPKNNLQLLRYFNL